MRELITPLLTAKRIFSHDNKGVLVCSVKSPDEGLDLAKELLYLLVDSRSILYLSGGKTPEFLYEQIAKEEKLIPGVVGLVDERYGEPMHEKSNEKMIAKSGLVRYLSYRDIPYYSMLRGIPIEETANRYDELVRSLGTVYRKSIAVLGIGNDGHTAGIAPDRADFHNPMFSCHAELVSASHSDERWIPNPSNSAGRQVRDDKFSLVSWFNDEKGPLKERVTMTFLGLSMLDFLVILVFGEEKREALKLMFEPGSEEDVPARFYLRPDIAKKTILITDQRF